MVHPSGPQGRCRRAAEGLHARGDWYGFYSAYTARRYFPDAVLDGRLERRFHEVYPLLYQSGTGLPLVQEDRIQNHSSMLGIFVCRYACTADIADLEQAHRLAELVLRFQREDGGFYKGDTDYTSVIYCKSIMELVRAQLARAEDAAFRPKTGRCGAGGPSGI